MLSNSPTTPDGNSLSSVSATDENQCRILVIDPDDVIRELIGYNLSSEFKIDACSSAEDALEFDLPLYWLIILDTQLGGKINGLEFIEMLQRSEQTSSIPFIICSARDREDDILRGFDAGADDYIVKPFSLREMVARVHSVLRRHHRSRMSLSVTTQPIAPKVIRVESLRLTPDRQLTEVDGVSISLSRIEFQLLRLFASNVGQLFDRDHIKNYVWPSGEQVSPRAIDVNISRLRKKLGPKAPVIVNRPGQGYGILA